MKTILKCSAFALAAGAIICIHREAIADCYKDAKKCLKKTTEKAKKKPTIVLLYDSTPCNCEECHCEDSFANKSVHVDSNSGSNTDAIGNSESVTDNEVSETLTDSCCGPMESTGCGCDQGCCEHPAYDDSFESYKKIFEKFKSKANCKFIDTSASDSATNAKINDYIDRFGVEYLPAVLVLSPCENLIAKIEAPENTDDIEQMLDYCL